MLLGTEVEVMLISLGFPIVTIVTKFVFFFIVRKLLDCNSVVTRSLKSGLSYNYLLTNVEKKNCVEDAIRNQENKTH